MASSLYSASLADLDSEALDDVMGVDNPAGIGLPTKEPHLAHMDLSMLVGVPPPPPKTPPPKRNRRSRSAAISAKPVRSQNANAFDETNVLLPATVSRVLAVNQTQTTPGVSEAGSSSKPALVPAPRDTKKTLSIAEERRRTALAMYRSEDLVLDHEETAMAEELLRPAVTTKENKPEVNPLKVESSSMSVRSKDVVSLTSEITEHHSNQTHSAFSETKSVSSKPSQDGSSLPGMSRVENATGNDGKIENPEQRRSRGAAALQKSQTQGDKKGKKGEKQKRGLFGRLFRGKGKDKDSKQKGNTKNVTPTASAASSVSSKRSGVANKVPTSPFGFKSPPNAMASTTSNSTPPVASSKDSTTMNSKGADTTAIAPMPPSPSNDGANSGFPAASLAMTTSDDSFFSALKTPRVDPPDEPAHGVPPMPNAPTLEPENESSLGVSILKDKVEIEDQNIESARSRIAGVYGGNVEKDQSTLNGGPISSLPDSLSDERPEIFFSQDEVSILTGPSFESLHKRSTKSFDPAPSSDGANSDPLGHYSESGKNRSTADDGLEPEEADIVPPVPQDGDLVDVPGSHTLEPVGESPLHDGMQAFSRFPDPVGDSPMAWARKANGAMANDPVGESPVNSSHQTGLHDPTGNTLQWNLAPTPTHNQVMLNVRDWSGEDPPLDLTAGYISDDSSTSGAEEKKEDEDVDAFPKNKTTPISKPIDGALLNVGTTDSMKGKSKATQAALKLVKSPDVEKTNQKRPSTKPASSKEELPKGTGVADATRKNLTVETASSSSKLSSNSPLPSKRATKSNKETHDKKDTGKSGFRSGSNTPSSTEKPLTVSGAAFTNAKAVAYLHRLHGQPSPRHSWLKSQKKKTPDAVTAQDKPASSTKKSLRTATQSGPKTKPNPEDYGSHKNDEHAASRLKPPTPENATLNRKASSSDKGAAKSKAQAEKPSAVPGSLFSSYRSKFHGRTLSKKTPHPHSSKPRVKTRSTTPIQKIPTPKRLEAKPVQAPSPRTAMKQKLNAVVAGGSISSVAVARGITLRKDKRDDDVASGRAARVILTPVEKPTGGNRFNFVPADESEIKDPIQRAGRRLLSKAAIPIQCAARKFLAKNEAVDRMWALIEVQSYFRRWRCETNLQASIHSATLIQAHFRGWLARDKVKDMQYCAVQIQKVVRGYLASVHAFDAIYCVARIQALVRGHAERKALAMKNETALFIQSVYRGHLSRREADVRLSSISMIQTTWRSYSERIKYQFQIVDIIIAQSVVRRWAACRRVASMKNAELSVFATKVQKVWRGYSARESLMQNLAACRIQAAWRGFQSYTDYIFALVDILVVQRTVRRFLAIRRVKKMRKEAAAVKIQSQWRRKRAQMSMLYTLVHIIIVQSVVRRYLSRSKVRSAHTQQNLKLEDLHRKEVSATKIQKVWRGFWGFSHYIIMQYEITRLQALVRGKLARQSYSLSLGCAIIIQATVRQYLAKKRVDAKVVSDALLLSRVEEMRERNASKRIQFWWRIVLDWTKEKKAALTIERFFIHVREEVDREILRREKKKSSKKEKRRRKRRESSEEHLLERAWLNTVDEERADGFSGMQKSPRSQSASRAREVSTPRDRKGVESGAVPHRASSPTTGLVMRHEEMDKPIQRMDSSASNRMRAPTDTVRLAPSEDASEVSNLTTPSVFLRPSSHLHRQVKPSRTERTELTDEFSLEEGYGERTSRSSRRMSTEEYIQKYGSKGASKGANNYRMPSPQAPKHFFSNEQASPRRSSNGMSRTPISSRSQPHGTTPRNHLTPRNHQKTMTPRGVPRQPHGPSPRVRSGGHSMYPPQTPPRQKSERSRDDKHSTTRSQAETADVTSYSSHASHGSPIHHQHRGHSVLTIKGYQDFPRSKLIEESHEVQYLGDEFGEV